MAFVFEAERFKKEKKNNEEFYLEHKQYVIKKSKIPFNTTQKRSKNFNNNKNKKTKQQILFENFHRLLDKKKQLIYEHLKKIKQPKKQKFPQQNKFRIRKSQSVELQQIIQKELSPKRMRQTFQPPLIPIKILKNPTIPNEGNLDMKKVKLVKNIKKQKKVSTKDFKIPTNPFYYGKEDEHPEVDFLKEQNLFNTSKNIIEWKQQLKKTKSLQPKKEYSDQCFYTYKDTQPLYKLKQSSFFQSKVPKTKLYFDNIITENYKKLKNIPQDTYLKENIPGPGYYYNTDKEVKKKNQEHQFFDSSAPRFQIVNQQFSVDAGIYNHKGQFEQIKNYNSQYGNLSFQTFTKKFLDLREKDKIDVPYKIKHSDFKKKTYNSKKYFINKDDRFEYQKEPTLHTQKARLNEQKEIEEHINHLEIHDRIIQPINRREVPFNVCEERLKKKEIENVPFTGYYEVNNDSIKQKLEKLLENQTKKENYDKIYFESRQQRWNYKQKKKEIKKDKINRVFKEIPSYYYIPEVLKPTKIPFQTTSKRFIKKKEDDEDSDIRGIARPEWEKKSFNIKYQLFEFKFINEICLKNKVYYYQQNKLKAYQIIKGNYS